MNPLVSILGICFLPVVILLLLVLAIAALVQLAHAGRRLWCSVAHRRHHFHGLSLARCLKCGRLWVGTVYVVPGGGERSAAEPRRLRRVQ